MNLKSGTQNFSKNPTTQSPADQYIARAITTRRIAYTMIKIKKQYSFCNTV